MRLDEMMNSTISSNMDALKNEFQSKYGDKTLAEIRTETLAGNLKDLAKEANLKSLFSSGSGSNNAYEFNDTSKFLTERASDLIKKSSDCIEKCIVNATAFLSLREEIEEMSSDNAAAVKRKIKRVIDRVFLNE